jgi:hypothetical protein
MTTLYLRNDCLADPTRIDLAAVEFMMLWPDDPDTRQAAMNALLLEEGESFINEMGVDIARPYAKLAKSGARLSAILASQGDRRIHGAFVGRIVLEAIWQNNAGRPVSLRTIREKLARDMLIQNAGTAGYQISPQTLANKDGPATKFRPVAHLWAAHVYRRSPDSKAFPCRYQDLEPFLGLAEAIRELGEKTKTPHSKTAIMTQGEAVQLPAGIKPAKVVIDFKSVDASSDSETQVRIR